MSDVKLKLDNRNLAIGIIIAYSIFFFLLFGATGVRTFLAVLAIFLLPFYIILRAFGFENNEILFFSFFIGISLFSAIAYGISFLFSSVRVGIAVTFVLLILIGIILNKKSIAAKLKKLR